MKAATSGTKPSPFPPAPEGIVYVTIDKETGLLAGPHCPTTRDEAFVAGTEPREVCGVHGG
jgi:penicillin-binding protein 2D